MKGMSRKGVSRRAMLKAGAGAGVAAALGGVGGWMATSARRVTADPPRPAKGPEVLVLWNGKIHTMDARNTIASAVAIRDGRFLEVGPTALSHQGAGTQVINLQGHTVVPGIIDNHNHIVLMGNRPGHHTPLENAYSIADIQAIYAERARGVPPGEWITTIGGFNQNHFFPPTQTPRLPTLDELDAAVPHHPVFILQGFTGPSTTNTLGKQFFQANGVTVGANGSIEAAPFFPPAVGNTVSGRALYLLRKTLLQNAPDGFERRKQSVLDAMAYAVSVGVTTHLDQGAFQTNTVNPETDGSAHEDNFTMHLPFLEVYDEDNGIVRLRINFLHMETDPALPELVQRLKNQFPFFGGDLVRTGGIGEFITVVPSATDATSITRFNEAAKKVARARWRAEVHSLGRRATPASNPADFELEIMGFEGANSEVPGIVADTRWVIAHVPGITQEWVDRFKRIGGSLSLTGWQYLAGVPSTSTVAPYAGPPFRLIVDSGIHAGMSSDGMQIAPMNPWIHMFFATTGLNARNVQINPNQQISRQEVLELYTRRNGFFLREEDQLGTIEEGKLADLVVLNKDYFDEQAVPADDLKQIRSILTIVDGDIVHDAGVLSTGHGRGRKK
jgi:predicted amidohydrolase YtcJ